jgi:hypothetical protein
MYNQIIEKQQENITLYLYLNTVSTSTIYSPKQINSTKVIKKKLEKYTQNTSTKNIIELHYKNLLCVYDEQSYNYLKITNNKIMIDSNMLLISNVNHIPEEEFPKLKEYDYECKKQITYYHFNTFDVLFIEQNKETIVCIDVTKLNDEKQFNKILNLFQEFFKTDCDNC